MAISDDISQMADDLAEILNANSTTARRNIAPLIEEVVLTRYMEKITPLVEEAAQDASLRLPTNLPPILFVSDAEIAQTVADVVRDIDPWSTTEDDIAEAVTSTAVRWLDTWNDQEVRRQVEKALEEAFPQRRYQGAVYQSNRL